MNLVVYFIFCDDIPVVGLVTPVVDLFVDAVAAFVSTGLAGVIVII